MSKKRAMLAPNLALAFFICHFLCSIILSSTAPTTLATSTVSLARLALPQNTDLLLYLSPHIDLLGYFIGSLGFQTGTLE
jgi:hypothetical protein